MAVKKLESKLGVNLLNRTTRQLSLTEEGALLFHRMQVILQDMKLAEDELINTQKTPQGHYVLMPQRRLFCISLVPLLKQFQQKYPQNNPLFSFI